MRNERIPRTLLLAGVLIAVLGKGVLPIRWEGRDIFTGVADRRFSTMKVHGWGAEHDAVVLGDSRVYRGVSPAALADALPGTPRTINYGFNASGYGARYLASARSKLDPRSPAPRLALGVSPYTLTPRGVGTNGFIDEIERPRSEVIERLYLDEALAFFEPLSLRGIKKGLRGDEPLQRYYHHNHADGWVASRKQPEDPTEALAPYETIFDGNQVSRTVLDGLAAAVRRWTAEEGIRVYAFRPPTTPAMVALEARRSGFDEAEVVRVLEAAGAVWLPFGPGDYHSYDGSHLERDAAAAFSRDLGRAITAAEAGGR